MLNHRRSDVNPDTKGRLQCFDSRLFFLSFSKRAQIQTQTDNCDCSIHWRPRKMCRQHGKPSHRSILDRHVRIVVRRETLAEEATFAPLKKSSWALKLLPRMIA